MFVVAILAARADDLGEIRAVFRAFNETTRKPEARSLERFFTSDADYKDGARTLAASDALLSLFTDRQVWSERTVPTLQEEFIRLMGGSAAFVDAKLVRYGSTIVKSSIPVVLLLQKQEGGWKITSWRMPSCAMPLSPPE